MNSLLFGRLWPAAAPNEDVAWSRQPSETRSPLHEMENRGVGATPGLHRSALLLFAVEIVDSYRRELEQDSTCWGHLNSMDPNVG